jgi:hypothetical protein
MTKLVFLSLTFLLASLFGAPGASPKLGGARLDYFQAQKVYVQNAGNPWNYSTASDVTRFEVRQGDRWATDGAAPKERSEVAATQTLNFGKTYAISFGLMIEPGAKNTADWMTLLQVQSNFDAGEAGHSPAFALEMAGEKMQIMTRSSPSLITTTDIATTRQFLDVSDIVRGHWYAFTITIRLDPFGNGQLDVVRDGVRLVHYEGALGFNDRIGSYLKEGVYRETSTETFAVDYRKTTVTELALAASADQLQAVASRGDDLGSYLMGLVKSSASAVVGDGGANVLQGGVGDDLLRGGLGADVLKGGLGVDTADFSDKTSWLRVDLNLGAASVASVAGRAEDSLISIENVIGGSAADVINGDSARNQLFGGAGNDQLQGMGGDDVLDGGLGNDKLVGGDGADLLSGGAGADTLEGGAGVDRLYGGSDNDVFRFTRITDSRPTALDIIGDFAKGDRLDLATIDANALSPGDQAFVIVQQFNHVAGQLMLQTSGSITTVMGDVNGDGVADFGVQISGTGVATGGWLL